MYSNFILMSKPMSYSVNPVVHKNRLVKYVLEYFNGEGTQKQALFTAIMKVITHGLTTCQYMVIIEIIFLEL